MCFGVNRRRNGTHSNLVFVFEWKKPWCECQRVLDHYFNVRLGVSRLRNGTRLNLVLLSTRRCWKAINGCFYVLFVFTSWWQGLITARFIRRQIMQQEYSPPPILPSPHFQWVVKTGFRQYTLEGVGGGGVGVRTSPHFGRPSNFIKRENKRCVWAGACVTFWFKES